MDGLVQKTVGNVLENQWAFERWKGVAFGLVFEFQGHDGTFQQGQVVVVYRGLLEVQCCVKGLVGSPNQQQGTQHGQAAYCPCHTLTDELPLVALPDGVELHAQKLGYELHIGPLTVEPWHTVDFLVDVGAKDFGQSQLVDDGVEAFCIRIAAVGCAFDDEEMDALGATEAVEILDFFAYPFRLGRVG